MDLLWFTLLYMGLVGAFLFVMLFGELSIFRGTPMASLHWFITGGFCDYLWWAVERVAGQAGKQRLSKVEDACCNRPNPLLQGFYLALLFAAYYLYSRDILVLLPLPYAPAWHQYTGAAAVFLCLLSFYITSVSDPGAISSAHLSTHLRLYDYDDVTCFQKDCWTCTWQRPARSKHCPVCNRCIARFDHHCAWVNNCIGLLNLRCFLAFLLCNILLCAYAVALAGIVLYGEMQRHRIWDLVVLEHATGRLIALKDSRWHVLQWLLANYTVPVTLTTFLLIAMLMVCSFLGYHLRLVARGMTTYETFKRQEYRHLQREHARVMHQGQAGVHLTAPNAAAQIQPPASQGLWRRSWWQRQPKLPVLPHAYDKGLHANVMEVLFPEGLLQAAAEPSGSRHRQAEPNHEPFEPNSKKSQ